ncbi:MAG: NAD(P)-dependent oxidoreductase [Sedimentisphaeraceae bacterium JB056]
MNIKRIGFIGMGIMGAPMAINLIKAGFQLTVTTRTKSKAYPVIEAGAAWVDTPAQAAKWADLVICCVTDTPDVEKVLLGSGGVIEQARVGLICVDMSTISPFATEKMAGTLAEKGVSLIDAPISGGQIGAEKAKLSIMAGGEKAVFDKVMPVFEAMGRQITYCGKSGSGQRTKLVNQVMVVHTLMSACEGLAFAKKAGLDLQTTHNATSKGAAGSHSLNILGQKIIDGDMKPSFMVDLQMKDLRLVLEYADRINQPLPGVALVKQMMASLQAKGRGRDGTQSLYDVIVALGSEND